MFSFHEQVEVIESVFSNVFTVDNYKKYTTRGNNEENAFNRLFILNVFKHRLTHGYDYSNDYLEFVKLYVNIFIINNSVYYKESEHMKYCVSDDKPSFYTKIARDVSTNRKLMKFKHDMITNKVYIMTTFKHGYKDKQLIEIIDVNNLVFKYVNNISVNNGTHTQECETLKSLLELDRSDEFIDFINTHPSILNYEYIMSGFHVSLLMLTILFKAIKCFKFLLLSNLNIKQFHNIEFYLMLSNNVSIYRILDQSYQDYVNPYVLAKEAIRFHRNRFFEHLFYTYDLDEFITGVYHEAIINYNYKMLLFMRENSGIGNEEWSNHINEIRNDKHALVCLYMVDNRYIKPCFTISEILISLPWTGKQFVETIKRLPQSETPRKWIMTKYLTKCFQYGKSKEYIQEIINFCYGKPKLDYNDEYNKYLDPFDVLKNVYDKHYTPTIDTKLCLEILFPKNYVYRYSGLKEIIDMFLSDKVSIKEVVSLLKFYVSKLSDSENGTKPFTLGDFYLNT